MEDNYEQVEADRRAASQYHSISIQYYSTQYTKSSALIAQTHFHSIHFSTVDTFLLK